MATAYSRRRGTTTQHATFAGLVAELTVDTTKDTVVVHDGATSGGFPLAREDLSNVSGAIILQLLSGAALNAVSISGATISASSFNGGNISATTISASTFNAGTISGSTLSAVTVNGSTISGATINASTISGGTISAAALNGSTVSGATISASTFNAGTISGSILSAVTINGSTLSAVTLNQVTVSGGTISAVTINGSNISGGTISGAVHNGGSMSGTTISASTFNGGTISGTTLSAVTINTATISAPTINGGTMSGTTLSACTLNAAIVSGITLNGSTFPTGVGVSGQVLQTNGAGALSWAAAADAASETVSGIAELATQTETDTGTDDARIITPLKLKAAANLYVRSQQFVAFRLIVANTAGTLQHKMISPDVAFTVASNFVGKVTGALNTYTNTPTGTDSSTAFAAGGKIGNTTTGFVFDTADQTTAGNLIITAVISYNDTGTAFAAFPTFSSRNVNGVTRTRPEIRCFTVAGAIFSLDTTNITAGKLVVVDVWGYWL